MGYVLVCITNYFTIESIEIVYILIDDTQNLNISGSLSQAMTGCINVNNGVHAHASLCMVLLIIIMEASIYRWVSVVPHDINPQFMHAEFLQEVSFNTVVRR